MNMSVLDFEVFHMAICGSLHSSTKLKSVWLLLYLFSTYPEKDKSIILEEMTVSLHEKQK